MKTLSLKLDDRIFEDTEKMSSELKLARNRYINQAVDIYNQVNKRRSLKKQLSIESKATCNDSMEVMADFEKLMDENQAV